MTRGYRGTPDVSYNADPGTDFAVYDSVALSGASGWFCVGGTSAGSPQWAASRHLQLDARRQSQIAALRHEYRALLSRSSAAANFHPVNSGTNGSCGALCTASAGYDYVTGIGTPAAASLINILAAQ